MITSEYGLHEIKHLTAPVGIKELHCAMQKKIINDISGIPFYFIPGVKNDADTPENADMMRGEETELMGLINENSSDYVYVLPGSHSKLILLDEQQRISSFQTMLTGEMISALSQHTILKGTVDLNVSQYDVSSLITGYEYCLNYGINKALFTTRILKNIFNKSDIENYSYFLGVVLANEIEALRKCKKNGVIIGGKSQIKNAMRDILKIKTDFDVICIPDEDVDCCVPIGAIRIFEYKT